MLKNFLLGFGCGLIVLAAVIYFYAAAQEAGGADAAETAAFLSDDEIVERARELGMYFYMDFIRSDAKTALTEIETEETPAAYGTVTERLTDDEIIDRAYLLGMVFPSYEEEDEGTEQLDEKIEDEINFENRINFTEPIETESEDENDIDGVAETPLAGDEIPITDGEIRVFVPSGSNAIAIANSLQANGVITNARDFIEFIVERGMAARLMSGEHVFTGGMDYEQILAVLRGWK